MHRALLILLMTVTCFTMNNCDSSPSQKQATIAACVDTLQQAMTHAQSFFIKVHAAEALLLNGHEQGVEELFTRLQTEKPEYTVGATRVLARLYQKNAEKR